MNTRYSYFNVLIFKRNIITVKNKTFENNTFVIVFRLEMARKFEKTKLFNYAMSLKKKKKNYW